MILWSMYDGEESHFQIEKFAAMWDGRVRIVRGY